MDERDAEPLDEADELAEVVPFPTVPFPTSSSSTDEPERPKVRDAIGEVLREERTEQGRTLADVAEKAAVSLPYLSEIERGRKEVSSDLLESVCDALVIEVPLVLERAARRLRARSQSGVMMMASWIAENLVDDAILERFLASQDEGSFGVGSYIVLRSPEMPGQQRFGLVSNPCQLGGFEGQVTDRAAAGF